MERLSNSASGSVWFLLTTLLCLFCLVLPGPLTAQEYGSISGKVYNADGGIPFDQAVYVQVVHGDPCEHWEEILKVTINPTTGAFALYGVPAEQPIFIRISNTGFTYAVENWWNSEDGGSTDCNQAEEITLSSGQELTDLSLFTRHAGNISGTVYEADGMTPVENLHVYAVTDACDGMWLSGTNTDETGFYTLTGIPETRLPEDKVYVKTCAECNGHPFVDQIYDGGSGTFDCDQGLGVEVTAGETTPGIDFQLEHGVTISGRVTDTLGNPIPGLWLHAFDNACNGNWLGGGTTNEQGYYTTSAMPSGDVYIEACPRCDDFQFNNSWWTGPDKAGSTNCNDALNLNLQAGENAENIDFTLEYPIFVEINRTQRPDGSFDAWYGIYFFNFNNFDLNSIVSIEMIGPSGTPVYHYTRGGGEQNDFVENQWNGLNVQVFNEEPEVGEYTFNVVTDDFSTTVTHVRNENKVMPVLDAETLSPANGSVITSRTPVFTWGSLEDPQMPVYYRFQIFDNTGYRVYASERSADMRSIVPPQGILQPGQTYTWRVQINDSSDYTQVENLSVTESFTITMADDFIPGTNPPVIHIDGFGAWNASMYSFEDDSTGLWVKVIDHDGIAYDGSSHQVSATFNGQTLPLNLFRYNSAFEARYENFLWIDPQLRAGEYVFTVTDPDGNTATATDTLEIDPLPIPDQNAFHVVSEGTSPAFTWDPVPDTRRYRIRIWDENWNIIWNGYQTLQYDMSYTVPPGVLLPHTFYFGALYAWDDFEGFDVDNTSSSNQIAFTTGEDSENPMIEIEHGAATRNSPDQGAYLYFWIKVHDAQGVPDNIQSVTARFPDGTTIPLEVDYNESDTCGIYYAEDFSLPIAAGEYTITVTDLDGNIHSVTDTLDVNPIGFPAEATVNSTVTGTRVDVAWEEIDEAAYYRLEIYDMDGNRLHTINTLQNTYVIPAGYLKENTAYQYRITTWREFFDQEVSNSSRSVMKPFEIGSNQDVSTQTVILTHTDPDITVSGGQNVVVYGTSTANHIVLQTGAHVEMINCPGQNIINIQSSSELFNVSRSGTMVTFQESDGTILKIPATTDPQTIAFTDEESRVLQIHNGQVMLDDQVVTASPTSIEGNQDEPVTCGAYVAPGVWKEFDCYNLAAIGKITGADPFTPSWELIGGYWQWGRKGPDSSEWYDTNTEHFAHGPISANSDGSNDSAIVDWVSTSASNGSWSDNEKTANDPCPPGFRVPSISQWENVIANNTQLSIGTWTEDGTNYSSAMFFGNDLMLPAAGSRFLSSGALNSRGANGGYWSSLESGSGFALGFRFTSETAYKSAITRGTGFSVRCISE